MRVIRLADARVVVHVRCNDEVLVAIPSRLSEGDILDMASLVLSSNEFAELIGAMTRGPEDQRAPPAALRLTPVWTLSLQRHASTERSSTDPTQA